MTIDPNFNFYSDAKGGDPDSTSPTLRKYHKFLWSKPLPNGKTFDLCDDFIGYIQFFLLEDLIDENKKIKFYLPFDNFKTRPAFSDTNDYLSYKKGVMNFIRSRNCAITEWSKAPYIQSPL